MLVGWFDILLAGWMDGKVGALIHDVYLYDLRFMVTFFEARVTCFVSGTRCRMGYYKSELRSDFELLWHASLSLALISAHEKSDTLQFFSYARNSSS